MSSTFPDHLVSGENVADAVYRAPGADDVSDAVRPGQSCEASMPDEPVEASQLDGCPSCGEQFAELQSRISQIEQRLGELLSDRCDEVGRRADSNPDTLELGDSPAETRQAATTNSQSEVAECTETPAYTARLVRDDVQSPPSPAEEAPSEPTDLPKWAEAYQNDDVDESVRDYVEQLLQRMSTDEGGESSHSEATAEANSDASRREVPCSSDDSTDPPEAEVRPPRDDLHSCASRQPEASEPDRLAAGAPPIIPPYPTDERTVSRTYESRDLASHFRAESPEYARAEPYSPRSLPPERLANLNEMRALANISATAAIRIFEKGRVAKNTFDRLPLIMVGVSCGLFLLYFATTCDSQLMKLLLYAGVGFSFLAAAVATGQALSVLFRWMATARSPKTPPKDAPHTPDTLSTDDC